MALKSVRGGRLASIISGLVLGASALLYPLSSKGDDGVRLLNYGDGISVTGSALDLGHMGGSQETNDVNDITWDEFEEQFPNGNNKWLKTDTKPYGVQLQTDGRPPNSETTFEGNLSPVDKIGDGVTSTNRVRFIIGTDNLNRDYAAKFTQTNYLPSGTNFTTNFDIRDVINLDSGYVDLPGIVNVSSGTVYATMNVGCGFYLDKIFITNKADVASGVENSGIRLIHLGGPEASDGEDMHDSTRKPNMSTNLWLGAYTSPYGTNLTKDVRSRNGTNSHAFNGKLFCVNNTGGNISFSNSLEAILNYVTESNRNYRANVDVTNGAYRANGQPFSITNLLSTGNNVIPIGIITNMPVGTNDYADFSVKEIFPIVSSNGNNGTISPLGTNWVAHNEDGIWAVNASIPGYHISQISTNGIVAVTNDNNDLVSTNLVWPAVTSNGTIYAVFDINKYLLTVNSDHNGEYPGTITTNHGVSLDQFITNSPVLIAAGLRAVANGGVVSGNSYTQNSLTNITINGLTNNAVLNWLWQTQALFNASSQNGNIQGETNKWCNLGDIVTVTNNPNAHYHPIGWSGDTNECTINGNQISVPMNIPRTITASNEIDRHTLEGVLPKSPQ